MSCPHRTTPGGCIICRREAEVLPGPSDEPSNLPQGDPVQMAGRTAAATTAMLLETVSGQADVIRSQALELGMLRQRVAELEAGLKAKKRKARKAK